MKVFFSATPSRIQEYRKNYQLIGKIIEGLGHQHTTRWILDFKDEWLDALPRDLWKAHYQEIVAGVAAADLAVLDISGIIVNSRWFLGDSNALFSSGNTI